jgi:uridine kinase
MRLIFLFLLPIFSHASLIIGIAGGTGSGKSTLAEKLLETFGSRATLVSQDDYYQDLSHLPPEERTQQNFDHPNAIDFTLLRQHVLCLKQNKSIDVPCYDFRINSRTGETRRIEPSEIILLEGILIFAVPEIRELCDLKIFVETDDDIRLLRRIERDMNHRARDFKSIRDQYITTVKPMHDAFVEPSKRFADVILPSIKRNDNGIALIVASLKKGHDFTDQVSKDIKDPL